MRVGIGRNPLNSNKAGGHLNIPGTFVPNNIADSIIDLERLRRGL